MVAVPVETAVTFPSESTVATDSLLLDQFTDLSVCEIASNLAFCSQSYFNTRFKKCVGVTPLQFRGISVDDISNKLEYYLQDTE